MLLPSTDLLLVVWLCKQKQMQVQFKEGIVLYLYSNELAYNLEKVAIVYSATYF